MTFVPHDSLFQIVGIGSYLKHMDIVIGFQQNRIQILQILHRICIIFSKIGRDSHSFLILLKAVSARFICIMRNGKCMDINISHPKILIYMDFPVKPVRHFPQSFVFADSSQGSGSGIDWNLILPAEYPQSLNMVGMFMGDQNSVQFLTFDFQRTKSLFNLFSADSRIH